MRFENVVRARHEAQAQHSATQDQRPSTFIAPDTIDAARHKRMIALVEPLIQAFPGAHWLTVGDGGADGWMLQSLGASHVCASSISSATLAVLQAEGHLNNIEIQEINAENIDLPSQSVDFILCKEAFHHFPRPPVALYEFLRVARKGVVLIEPVTFGRSRALDILKAMTKRVLRRRLPIYEEFEAAGNYIYRISIPETERLLTAMGANWFAYRCFNDFFQSTLASKNAGDGMAWFLFLLGLGVQDLLVHLRLLSPGLAIVFIPGDIEPVLADKILPSAFRKVMIRKNPYLESANLMLEIDNERHLVKGQ